ncbi:hypothetical protein AMAG_08127 [Allomyces macrogynus ATCC 38327]|uniref:Mitochondrial carrier n=1 Tax=Allomyces macrogynus (strain ATCC 38327) TaxID=578462 RepID=A0A0L0SKB9_ALLM3|nr:hypothetical protein AMAG_08127 [Allomyces macrogynus ATCC 38327]|eukprot:KNE62952.1 hypothetical protein AMAG_08127 [Allomyces macrogynus ATCC 38327]
MNAADYESAATLPVPPAGSLSALYGAPGAGRYTSGPLVDDGPYAYSAQDDMDEDSVVSPGSYARYAGLRFLGLAIWSPYMVASTLLSVQYLPNLATRQRLAYLGSSSDEEDDIVRNAVSSSDDEDNVQSGSERGNDDDDPFDALFNRPTTSSVQPRAADSRAPPTDEDGFVLHTYADDNSTRPLTMLPPLTGGLWSTVRAVRAHPDEGTLSLYKGLFSEFLRTMLDETMAPTLTASLCEWLGIDDTLLPVDHDNPIPITLVTTAAGVAVDVLLSPLEIARDRLIVQTARPSDRKYHGFLHAVRAQFSDPRSNPYVVTNFLVPTVAVSLTAHVFALATPLVIDRGLGISETYNPIKYATLELALNLARDLALTPLRNIMTRLYTQPAYHPRDGRPWLPAVPQSAVPYTGIRDCWTRMVREEGGARSELRKALGAAAGAAHAADKLRRKRRARRGDAGTAQHGWFAALEPLYQGFGIRVGTNVAYFLMRIMSEYIDSLGLEEDEF